MKWLYIFNGFQTQIIILVCTYFLALLNVWLQLLWVHSANEIQAHELIKRHCGSSDMLLHTGKWLKEVKADVALSPTAMVATTRSRAFEVITSILLTEIWRGIGGNQVTGESVSCCWCDGLTEHAKEDGKKFPSERMDKPVETLTFEGINVDLLTRAR